MASRAPTATEKDLAVLAAQVLKSRNANTVVKVKDLQTGEEIIIGFKTPSP
jgi:hypothetical protein